MDIGVDYTCLGLKGWRSHIRAGWRLQRLRCPRGESARPRPQVAHSDSDGAQMSASVVKCGVGRQSHGNKLQRDVRALAGGRRRLLPPSSLMLPACHSGS
jgi:hypothetical protein